MPSVTAAVRDDAGRLLLIHKIDNDFWALPGGAMELGETVADAAIREVTEAKSAQWVEVDELDDLPIHPSMLTRINDALGDRVRPRIA